MESVIALMAFVAVGFAALLASVVYTIRSFAGIKAEKKTVKMLGRMLKSYDNIIDKVMDLTDKTLDI